MNDFEKTWDELVEVPGLLRKIAEEHFNNPSADDDILRNYDVLQNAATELETLRDNQTKSHRERLPDTRESITHKFKINTIKGYMTVGMYEDGRPGELFIEIAKEGSTVGGLCDAIGILTSIALQRGVPIEELARKFRGTCFEPAGPTMTKDQPNATSIPDYIFTWMGRRFSPDFREEYEAKQRAMEEFGK